MSTMTQDQGETLANLIHLLRPDWGVAGTAKALFEARGQGDALTLARAALAAAADPGNRTPAIIGLNGAHWQGLHHKPAEVPLEELCDECGRPEPVCRKVARRTGDPHEFRTVAQAEAHRVGRPDVSAARGALAEGLTVDSSSEGEV